MTGQRANQFWIGGLFLAAVSGWGMAWKNAPSRGNEDAVQAAAGRVPAQRVPRNETRRSIGSLLENPRSAKLFSEIVDISRAGKPGSVNEKLMTACRSALMDPDPQSRSRDFALLLTQMRPEDGVALHQLFLKLHAEGRPLPEYASFATRWGEVDGRGAYEALMNQVPLRMPARDLVSIARGWGAKDPHAALAWMSDNQELAAGFGGREKVFESWMRTDPDAATTWLLQQPPSPELVACVAGAMPERLRGSDVMTAMKWLADLPDDEVMNFASLQGWQSVMNDLNEISYQSASDVWAVVREQPWVGFEQFSHLVQQTSQTRTATEGMSGFLDQLARDWPEEQVKTRFQQWSESEPKRIAGWLQNVPPSAVRTAAIRGLVAALEQTEPAAAEEWRRELEK